MFGIQLHTLIVHFPIALTFAAFFYDARGFYARAPRLYRIGSSLTPFAALAAVVATVTGFSLAGMSGLGSGGTVTGHAGLGILTVVVLVTVTFLRYFGRSGGGFSRRSVSNRVAGDRTSSGDIGERDRNYWTQHVRLTGPLFRDIGVKATSFEQRTKRETELKWKNEVFFRKRTKSRSTA